MPSGPEETLVICGLAETPSHSGFDDDMYGACAKCAVPIKWRPHSPQGSTKMCMKCAQAELGPVIKARITPQTLADIQRYFELEIAAEDTKKKVG